MADKIIAFVGVDKYELILYLSRILYHLNKKVLLVDFSENEALLQSVTIPETLKEDPGYIDYRGIDFIQGQYFQWRMTKDYNFILIDMGFHNDNEIIKYCNKVIYVTDLQLHNLKRIKNPDSFDINNQYLIIKDVFECKIKPDFVLEQIDLNVYEHHVFILFQDSVDFKVKVLSQYDHSFTFGNLSKPIQCFLKDMTMVLVEGITEKQINTAYHKAERGK